MEQTPEQTEARREPTDWGKKGLQILAILLAALALYLGASGYFGIAGARKDAALKSAAAFSTALVPLLDMRSKGQLADADTLQRVVDDMVSSTEFSFCAITDNQGRIMAASDRNLQRGSKYADIDPAQQSESKKNGEWEIVRPVVSGGVNYGVAVLRTR
ncbi:MAG TPA: PDC sensor domain-containing protein [Fimbriimonadales bacterium]|nr:PDC sensor domain-containing protein [Fimbriimonadales bacterium]